jgi:uncharacterized membrane protein
MLHDLTRAFSPLLTAFLASLVEGVEALTVVLAVGAVRGWRSACAGAGIALAALALLVAALGPLLARMPLRPLQLLIGVSILLFGFTWLRKAILRAACVMPQRDEAAIYAREVAAMRPAGRGFEHWDKIAMMTAFKIVMIEGLEVVFVVLAIAAGGSGLLPAAMGALLAVAIVVMLGIALRRPVERIPENLLKLGVGVLLCAFGALWVGEGLGVRWPGGDLSFLPLLAGFSGITLLLIRRTRGRRQRG